MSRVCEKYKHFKRNKNRDYFESTMEDISKPVDKTKKPRMRNLIFGGGIMLTISRTNYFPPL
jgi:hypothetical protein